MLLTSSVEPRPANEQQVREARRKAIPVFDIARVYVVSRMTQNVWHAMRRAIFFIDLPALEAGHRHPNSGACRLL